jgi:hypothetical protein
MNKPTHIITLVEPVNMAEEAKAYIQQKELTQKKESNSEFISRVLQKETYGRIYDLLDKNFDDNLNDFDELLRITEVSKDMGFTDQSGVFIDYLKEHFPVRWQQYLIDNKSDHSGASDQDNR